MKITDMKVTPIAVGDPPLLNAGGRVSASISPPIYSTSMKGQAARSA